MKTPIYTASTGGGNGPTLQSLLDAIEKIKALPEDPLKVWMKSKGYDPDNGARFVFPSGHEMLKMFGAFGPPDYIRLSDYVRTPTLVHNLMEII